MQWIIAFHIIAMVSWFAGLFYLPRLFVYHAGHQEGELHEQFCIMEYKLYHYIMTPAMTVTFLLGAWLTWLKWDYLQGETWFWLKMVLVSLLIGFTHHNGAVVKQFAAGKNVKSHKFYRYYNEFPTLMLIAVIILVMVRPF
ncbi:MAG: CopD family protein [Mariprofundaceae bacterium]